METPPDFLKRLIPAPGQMRVEGWLIDPPENKPGPPVKVPERPSGAPLVTIATKSDGSFELDLPALQENKRLRLIFTYFNADARLTETKRVDVSTYSLLSARDRAVGGNWSETVDDVDRLSTCTVRYEKKPLEIQIGGSAPAVIRMRDKAISLEFEGLNAIFLNTFILKAPYLNQNLQSFTVKAIVPSAKLLQVRPMLVSEAAVRARLPDGGKSADGREKVHFSGSVVCFPTCATMALGCLGALDVPDKGKTEHIQEVAQGIYDYVATDIQPPPWTFPFPADAAAKIAEDEKKMHEAEAAAKGLVPLVQAIADEKSVQKDEAAQMLPFRTYWPFVDATKGDENMQWLVTLRAIGPGNIMRTSPTASISPSPARFTRTSAMATTSSTTPSTPRFATSCARLPGDRQHFA